jgi:RNA-directed DNA polymerase
MQERHIEGVATHDDPEPCIDARKGGGEASAGVRTGTVVSGEIRSSRAPTPLRRRQRISARILRSG